MPTHAERIQIPVGGMTCAACQARVQRALARTPGVEDAAVNLLLHNASVTFDPAATSPERLVEAIRATGYEASVPTAPNESQWAAAFAEEAERERTTAREQRELGRKAVVSLVVGVLAMILSMPAMGAPPQAIAFVLLGLTTGVMLWAGRQFYRRAWAAARHHSADMNTLIAVGTGAAFVYSRGRDGRARLFVSRRARARPLLRSGHPHHRVHARRATRSRRGRSGETSAALRALVELQPPTARVVRDGDGASNMPGRAGARAATTSSCARRAHPRGRRVVTARAPWTSRC